MNQGHAYNLKAVVEEEDSNPDDKDDGNECKDEKDNETGNGDDDYCGLFSYRRKFYIQSKTKSCLLLDSQSTVDVFSNPRLLINIRGAKGRMTLNNNAGKL